MQTTVKDIVGELAREAAARAEEIESGGRLPPDLMEQLLNSGLLRVAVGPDLGGVDAAPAEWFELAMRCAIGDGSLGWTVAATISFNGVMAAAADQQFCSEFFADPRAILAGGVAGRGAAIAEPGGFEVQGRWDFCTGAWDATWLGGLCVERLGDCPPRTWFVMVPADRAEVHPNWDASGLRGTASETVVLPPQTVPAHWAMPLPAPLHWGEDRGLAGSYCRGIWPTAVAAAATQLGIARRALDEIAIFAGDKRRPDTRGVLITEQAFQRAYGRNEAAWLCARSALVHELEQFWENAARQDEPDREARRQVRLAASHAAQTGTDVVRACLDLAGATAIGRQHPIARCHRDGTILSHHAAANERTFELLARVSLGQDTDDPRL